MTRPPANCGADPALQAARTLTVRGQRQLSGGSFALEVDGPFPETRPGQFYMLRTTDRWPVLLPRPFSLYDRGPDGAWGSFLMKAIGPGTKALAAVRPGETVEVTGPLGRWFPADVPAPVVVAGGVGLAPFLLLAREQRAAGREPLRLLFGGRDREALAGMEDFDGVAQVFAATDDGSFGHHGLVTDLLDSLRSRGVVKSSDTVFCCGPDPMMHAVAAQCRSHGNRCFLSLETYMACGFGVCNGCTVEVRGGRFGDWPYSRTCMEGPVYDAEELVL